MRVHLLTLACVLILIGVSPVSGDSITLFEAGEFERARAEFTARSSEHPEDVVAMYYLAMLIPDAAKSRQLLERVLKADPQSEHAAWASFELAELLFAGPYGQYTGARKMYRAFLDTYPGSDLTTLARYRIGQTFQITNEPDSALAVFSQSIGNIRELHPLRVYFRLGQAEAKALAGRHEEALAESAPLMTSSVSRLTRTLHASLGDGTRKGRSRKIKQEYWVRVGVFGDLDNIRRLTERLTSAGYAMVDSAMAVGGLRMVLAGPFPDSLGAENARSAIEQSEGLRCRVLISAGNE
jgi:hypothetical protein